MLVPWFRKHARSPTAPPSGFEPIRHSFDSPLAAAQAALARFFAPNDARVADTLARFAAFCQRVPDASGERLLWEAGLAEALAALDRFQTPPERIVLTTSAWRYLVLTRVMLDQIEASLAVWQVALFDDKGTRLDNWAPTSGLMTAIDKARFYRVNKRRNRRFGSSEPITISGLGAVLAAYLLPPAGLDIVVDKAQQGFVWTDSATFWQFDAVPAGTLPKPNPPIAATSVNVAMGTRARTTGSRRLASPPSHANAVAVRSPASPSPSSPMSASLKAAFQIALRDYIESLRQHGALNHLQASGWVAQEALYLVGKEAAAALRRHASLAGHEQRLQKNAVLYRLLLGCQLTERHEDKPVWNITVMEAGDSRKAATLKIPVATLWPETAGPIEPFAGVIAMPGQLAPDPPVSMAKTPGSEPRSRGADAIGYSTLFDD